MNGLTCATLSWEQAMRNYVMHQKLSCKGSLVSHHLRDESGELLKNRITHPDPVIVLYVSKFPQ